MVFDIVNKKGKMDEEISFKENRIREVTFAYYSIPEIRKYLFNFSQNRETVPRYYEGFGKRPDSFQYESDILEQVKKGATSFHCSEELWKDPLEISNQLSEEEVKELRVGWDFLLDVDSPYLEYSKIYAQILIDILRFHGIENIGVKFSGGKGFHIIIPWNAFPSELYGQKTKDMFPEWPRIICQYLSDKIQPKLGEKILQDESLKDLAKKTGREEKEILVMECNQCRRQAIKKELVTWRCSYCNNEVIMIRKNKRIPKCPNDDCRKSLTEISSKEVFYCEYCNINSFKNPLSFGGTKKGFIPSETRALEKERFKTEKLIDADLVLVAPRHLFRMPYSLHEKTALASIVIDKDKIQDFQIKDAKPFKVKVKSFYPDAKIGEAKELLLQALDWKEQKDKEAKKFSEQNKTVFEESGTQSSSQKKDYKEVKIQNPTPDLYPPCINLILNGVKQDGRKRSLFILINFFRALGTDLGKIESIISEWNKKNYKPLKEGYIRSQLIWYSRQKMMMPPNCDKPYYKDLAVCRPDELCRIIKNPVNYAMKKYFKGGNR